MPSRQNEPVSQIRRWHTFHNNELYPTILFQPQSKNHVRLSNSNSNSEEQRLWCCYHGLVM